MAEQPHPEGHFAPAGESFRLERGALVLIAWITLLAALGCGPDQNGPHQTIDELAAFIARSSERTWTGPRVPPPTEVPRPPVPLVARSALSPLAVHAAPSESPDRVDLALEALETTALLLRVTGWPSPHPDGGEGGTLDFDLYLAVPPQLAPQDGELPRSSGAESDGLVVWSYLDATRTYAWIDPNVSTRALPACVASAYAEAILLGNSPAEATSWRRATADWLAWMVMGEYGCDDRAIAAQQQQPWRAPIDTAADGGAGGALFVTWLSERHDRSTGRFIRDLWALASQRTWEGVDLRASPDLWEATEVAVELSDDDFHDAYEDFAVGRWFTGSRVREAHTPEPVLTGLPSDAAVHTVDIPLPPNRGHRTDPFEPALEPLGSGYVLYHVSDARPGSNLRLWLRGEWGVRWSFVAVKLDADGKELGRVTAPPRERNPDGFLEVDLTDTDRVLVVVTNLSNRWPDADTPNENVRSFELISDVYHPSDGPGEGPTLAPR